MAGQSDRDGKEKMNMREHIAGNLTIVPDDFEYSPFAQEGGMGRVYQLFGVELPKVLEAMNRELAA